MNVRMIAALSGLACAALFAAMPHVWAKPPASMPTSRSQPGGAQGIVAPGAKVVQLAKGFQFTEGPAVDREGNVFFSDVRASRTYKWSPDGKVSLFRKDTGGANGLAFDAGGNLLACEGAGGRIVSIDAKGSVAVVAGAYGGKPFNRPNDLWIDPKGGVYFSDPLYGRGSRRQDGEHVYYVTPDRKKVIRVIDDMVRPNGLAGTPDGKTLYVADAGAGRDVPLRRQRRRDASREDAVRRQGLRRNEARPQRQRVPYRRRGVGVRPGRETDREDRGPAATDEPVLRRAGRPDAVHHRPIGDLCREDHRRREGIISQARRLPGSPKRRHAMFS